MSKEAKNGNQSQVATPKQSAADPLRELKTMFDNGYGTWTSRVENSTGKPLTPEDFAVLSQRGKAR